MRAPPRVEIQIDIISFSQCMYMTFIQPLLTGFVAQPGAFFASVMRIDNLTSVYKSEVTVNVHVYNLKSYLSLSKKRIQE